MNAPITIFRDYREDGWKSMDVYADGLVRALTAAFPTDTVREYAAAGDLSSRFPPSRKLARYAFRYIVNPAGAVFAQRGVNHILDQANAHLLRLLDPQRTVITCHDLIVPIEYPPPASTPAAAMIKSAIASWRIRSLTRARHIIAVSSYTKGELTAKLEIDTKTVTVIPEGVEESFVRATPGYVETLKKTYGLPPKFVLHVGSCAPYKNMPYLLAVFGRLRRRCPDLYLVKAGADWSRDDTAVIDRFGLSDRIVTIPSIPRKDLPALYSAALCLIHPSHLEGFGLTVLEAMACGCPVAISDTPALTELAGNAGIIIPLNDPSAGSAILERLMTDSGLRTRRAELGEARARGYTWRQTARLTHRLYERIAHGV
jgi:glycosyltransferase involved in cell wall biosynthesis